METIGCCCRSRRRYEEIESVNSAAATASPGKLRWRALWMKLKREKRRLFMESSQVPYYDACSYAKNFDAGFTWDEPENLSRSFSVRFADPSHAFLPDKANCRVKGPSP